MVKGWTVEQFTQAIRTGVNPTGRAFDLDEMPRRFISSLDDELAGVYAYLLSFPSSHSLGSAHITQRVGGSKQYLLFWVGSGEVCRGRCAVSALVPASRPMRWPRGHRRR